MQPYLRRDYFFFKSAKLFSKIKPHLFGFCFIDTFKRYNLLTQRFKRRFVQPVKYKKTKYFKYDHYYWSRGSEGRKLKVRIARLLLIKYTGSAINCTILHKPIKTTIGDLTSLVCTLRCIPETDTESSYTDN